MVFFYLVEDEVGVHLVHQHKGAAEREHLDEDAQAGGVEEGAVRERHLGAVAVVVLDGEHEAVFAHHALRPEHGLGGAGGAAGEDDDGLVVGGEVDLGLVVVGAVYERGEVELVGAGLAQDYHAAELAVGRLSRVDGVGEPGLIRNGLAVHHVHDAGDLAGEEVGVDGHGRGADLLRGEKDEDDLGAVAEHIGDAVALAEADGGEGVGQPVHRPVELGPGVGLVLVDKGEPVGIHLRVADEEVFKLKHF